MFEKEAEELIEESKRLNTTPRETVRKALELGFQKGVKESANINVTFSDSPIKDEWHYVKDGDLPTEDTKVLALMVGGEVCIAHFYRKNVWDKIGIVYAWKEIVLPIELRK